MIQTHLLLKIFVRIWFVYFLKYLSSVHNQFMFDSFKLNEFVSEHIVREYIIKSIRKHINKFIRK